MPSRRTRSCAGEHGGTRSAGPPLRHGVRRHDDPRERRALYLDISGNCAEQCSTIPTRSTSHATRTRGRPRPGGRHFWSGATSAKLEIEIVFRNRQAHRGSSRLRKVEPLELELLQRHQADAVAGSSCYVRGPESAATVLKREPDVLTARSGSLDQANTVGRRLIDARGGQIDAAVRAGPLGQLLGRALRSEVRVRARAGCRKQMVESDGPTSARTRPRGSYRLSATPSLLGRGPATRAAKVASARVRGGNASQSPPASEKRARATRGRRSTRSRGPKRPPSCRTLVVKVASGGRAPVSARRRSSSGGRATGARRASSPRPARRP